MTDERLQGAPVLRQTHCKVGGHVFIQTSSGPGAVMMPWTHRCDCGAYTLAEWVELKQP